MKFYSKTQTITSVNLYKYDGKFWKSVPTNTGSTPVFPSVNLGSINMCLGWSKTMGKIPDQSIMPETESLQKQVIIIW